jgi:hypothetical protein
MGHIDFFGIHSIKRDDNLSIRKDGKNKFSYWSMDDGFMIRSEEMNDVFSTPFSPFQDSRRGDVSF